MSEKTIINGWTINSGDYISRDADYEKRFEGWTNRLKKKNAIIKTTLITTSLGVLLVLLHTISKI